MPGKNYIKIYKMGALIMVLLLLLGFYLPMLIQQEDSIIEIWDNLDSSVTYYMVLAETGHLFSSPDTPVENIMNGLPRGCLPSGLNVTAIIFWLFKPFHAYLINQILVGLLGFTGMFLLFKKHFLKESKYFVICLFSAFCFVIIPTHSIHGLSVLGIPLLLYAFLNLSEKSSLWISYIIIGLFPFYSSLILTGIFVIFCLFIFGIFDYLSRRQFNKHVLFGLLILIFFYLISEHGLIYLTFFDSGFVSHRHEFKQGNNTTFNIVFEKAIDIFYKSQKHVSNPPGFIIYVSIFALILGIARKTPGIKYLLLFFGINIAFSVIYGIYGWDLVDYLEKKIKLLGMFQWHRFYFLAVGVWYIIFGISIKIIYDSVSDIRFSGWLVPFIFLYVINQNLTDNKDFRINLYNTYYERPQGIRFQSFFSEGLFAEIKEFIGVPQENYRIASIGIYPNILQVNGFYTLDSYQYMYPLSYKQRFRKIISDELKKDKDLKKYFDEWGSRCYLYTSEVKRASTHTIYNRFKIKNLEIDTQAFYELGGRYIFSTVKILNYEENDLEYLGHFKKARNFWQIHLYKVNLENH